MNNYLMWYHTKSRSNRSNYARFFNLFKPIWALLVMLVLSFQVTAQDPWRGVRPQVLTKQQFSDLVTIVKKLKNNNVTNSSLENATFDQEITAMANNQKAVEILARYGYTPDEFVPLSVNVVLAHLIASSPESSADIVVKIKGLEGQKDSMDAEHYQATLSLLNQRLNFLKSAPEENISLAKKFAISLNEMTTEKEAQ